MNMKLKQCQANRHVLRSASAIVLVLIILLVMSLPVLASAAYGGVISQSDSFYVADEADVISSDTEKYIIGKNAELENLCGGQIVVVAVDFLDGMDIEDYAYKLFKDWQIGDEDRDNGILLLLAIGEENYWCMQGKGLEGALTSGDIDDILWNYLEDDFASGDYDSGVRSVFDALYDSVADIYGTGGEYDVSGSGSSDHDYGYVSAASNFARIIKMTLIVFLVVLLLLIITSIFFGRKNRGSRGGGPQYDRSPYDSSHTSRKRTRPIFIPTSRPSRPSGSSRPARPSRTTVSGSRSGSSRSSFGGGSRSSRGGGMGRGGGGSSRGGGAGRRGR